MRGRGLENIYGHSAIVWGILIVVLLLVAVFAFRFARIGNLSKEISVINKLQEQALATQEQLRVQLSHKNDPKTIEEAARELLGLVKPGEKKVIFVEGE